MIKEKLDEMVAESLGRLLEDPETRAVLADSADVDRLLKALMRTGEFQALLAGVRGLADNVAQMNANVTEIISTLKIHQSAIKNIMTIQDSLTKQAKSARTNVDLSLPTSTPEKPSKPN